MKKTILLSCVAGCILAAAFTSPGAAGDDLTLGINDTSAKQLLGPDLSDWLARTEFSGRLGGGGSEWQVLTTQPVWASPDGQHTVFTQLSAMHYKDFGDARYTANVGFGYRQLVMDDRVMLGANIFYDREFSEGHQRLGAGLEARSSAFETNWNYYGALTDARTIDSTTTERALSGWDGEVGMQLPYLPWAKVFARHYEWEGRVGSDIAGQRYSLRLQPTSWLQVEAGRDSNTSDGPEGFVTVGLRWNFGQPAASAQLIDEQAFRFNESMQGHQLDKVRRTNRIVVERTTTGGGGGGTLTVRVSRGS